MEYLGTSLFESSASQPFHCKMKRLISAFIIILTGAMPPGEMYTYSLSKAAICAVSELGKHSAEGITTSHSLVFSKAISMFYIINYQDSWMKNEEERRNFHVFFFPTSCLWSLLQTFCSRYFLNKEPHQHVFGSFLGHQPLRMYECLQFSSAEALPAGTTEAKRWHYQ